MNCEDLAQVRIPESLPVEHGGSRVRLEPGADQEVYQSRTVETITNESDRTAVSNIARLGKQSTQVGLNVSRPIGSAKGLPP